MDRGIWEVPQDGGLFCKVWDDHKKAMGMDPGEDNSTNNSGGSHNHFTWNESIGLYAIAE